MNIEDQAQHLIANNLIDLDAAVVELLELRAFRANVAAALTELRQEITARLFPITPEMRPDERLVNAGLQSALTQVDATITKLGLQEAE